MCVWCEVYTCVCACVCGMCMWIVCVCACVCISVCMHVCIRRGEVGKERWMRVGEADWEYVRRERDG